MDADCSHIRPDEELNLPMGFGAHLVARSAQADNKVADTNVENAKWEYGGGAAAMTSSERDAEAWQKTIENTVRSVVSVRFSQPYSFDTCLCHTSEATGFVIDSENGYILTNRHVVGTGPFWGRVIFHNQEEADAHAIYRDPIHDFGILKYDPKSSKYLDVVALNLRPDLAKVGVEIKVIGNDGGEKLSILSGFISRVDRNAPNYAGYRDFNTSYYQANAAASGGSSGSPVVNINGYAVALQAGGRTDKASTDYFLPLHAPLRALQNIQKGLPVSRGGIQASFLLKPFDECRRLGLNPVLEEAVRDAFPKENNMLVAETILPEGPSDEKIQEGDILIKVNGEYVVHFQDLEEILDGSIGKTLKFTLRRGDTDVEEDIEVEDLEKVTPSRFLAVSGAIFHDLSYQVANRYAIACKGVYICESGLLDLPKRNGWVVESIDYEDTPNLDKFMDVVKDLPDRARVGVRFRDLSNLHTLNTGVMTLNRHWPATMKLGTRNDKTGWWDFEVLSHGLPAVPLEPCKATFSQHAVQPAVAGILRSFVHIESTMPLLVDGVGVRNKGGMGLVIDADRGLVIVSREVVPHRMCTIEVTIADSILIGGEVIFLHPTQNYSIVRYDPNLVDAPVRSAVLDTEQVLQGAQTMFVGFTAVGRMVCAATSVTQIMPMEIEPLNPPMYRPMNMDWIGVDTSLAGECDSGVLMSTTDGKVQAFWMSFERESGTDRFGVPSTTLSTVLSRIRDGSLPSLRVLPVEFRRLTVFEARVLGVSEEWIDKIHQKESYHQLFIARRAVGHGPDQLMEGDVLLTLNGELITNATELDVTYFHETLDAIVVRDGEEMSLKLKTIPDGDIETSHLIVVCGLVLHKPHRAVRQQMKKLPSEVYIGSRKHGSPADVYCRLYPTRFITHLNDIQTPTLESVLEVAREIPDNTYFRIRGVSFEDVPFVVTIKKVERYFPMVEWKRDPDAPEGWRQTTYEGDKAIDGEGLYGILY